MAFHVDGRGARFRVQRGLVGRPATTSSTPASPPMMTRRGCSAMLAISLVQRQDLPSAITGQ